MANPPPPPAWPGQPQAIETVAPGPCSSFWIRFVAYMIDGPILIAALSVVFGIAVIAVAIAVPGDDKAKADMLGVEVGFGLLVTFIVSAWLYEALMTSSPRGATLGKMAIGGRIVRADGAQLSFGRATARHFLKVMITPLVPFAIGYLMAAFTARKRALHDVLADTLVVKVH